MLGAFGRRNFPPDLTSKYQWPLNHLNRQSLPVVEGLMTGEYLVDNTGEEISLVDANMLKFGVLPGTVPPDVIGFTLRSAAPVADTVRGVYGHFGMPTPIMIGIQSGKKHRERHLLHPATKKREIKKLGSFISDSGSVLLIDQHTLFGHSIEYASALILAAWGIESCDEDHTISQIRGRWYEDSGKLDKIRASRLTSRYSTDMYRIGKRCAEIAQARDNVQNTNKGIVQ